jgi:hypothetical protein
MSYTLTYGQGGLADAAQYLSSKGRGEDSQLIHMMPSEIEALQSLAEQHGRSLTINPQTGLPEAGWLGDILKVGATAAAVYYGGPLLGGALAPTSSAALQAGLGMGLISGGITTLSTGSLKQGLGAGLTTGLIGGMMTPGTPNPTDAVKTVTPALEGANQVAANAITNATPPAFSTDSFFSQIPSGASPVASTATQAPSIAPSFSSSVYPNYTPIPMSGEAVSSLGSTMSPEQSGLAGAKNVPTGLWDKTTNWWKNDLTPNERLMYGIGGVGALGIIGDAMTPKQKEVPVDKGMIRPYTYSSTPTQQSPYPTGPMYDASGNPILAKKEQNYFNQGFTALPAYKAADGGLMAAGGLGNMYPQSQQYTNDYATPIHNPISTEVLNSGYEQNTNPYTGEPIGYALGGTTTPAVNNKFNYDPATQQYSQVQPVINNANQPINSLFRNMIRSSTMPDEAKNKYLNSGPSMFDMIGAKRGIQNNNQNMGNVGMNGFGGMMGNMLRKVKEQQPTAQNFTYDPVTQTYKQLAEGGMANLGDYSDGGRLLKGPGDGVSDSIPASIGDKQPARLADGEFVIPARIVSELGNGSTDAGAKRLYAMMDKIQSGRKKTVGKGKVAVDSKAEKYLPA